MSSYRGTLRRAGTSALLAGLMVLALPTVAAAQVSPREGEPNCTGALLQHGAPGSRGALGEAVSGFAGPEWGQAISMEAQLSPDDEGCRPPG
jgi:hypothetical protein